MRVAARSNASCRADLHPRPAEVRFCGRSGREFKRPRTGNSAAAWVNAAELPDLGGPAADIAGADVGNDRRALHDPYPGGRQVKLAAASAFPWPS